MTATATTNASMLREGYEAFARGDLDRVREMFDPKIVWHEPGHSDIDGDYEGVDAVFGFFGRLFEETDGTFKAEPVDILADDDRGVVLQHVTASRNGKALDVTFPVVWEIRDGKPYDVRVYLYDMEQHDQFWN